MSSFYPSGLFGVMSGEISLANGSFFAILTDPSYVPKNNHRTRADVIEIPRARNYSIGGNVASAYLILGNAPTIVGPDPGVVVPRNTVTIEQLPWDRVALTMTIEPWFNLTATPGGCVVYQGDPARGIISPEQDLLLAFIDFGGAFPVNGEDLLVRTVEPFMFRFGAFDG